ncbi:hypothetical protein C8Q77DRAFT_1162288 [Trametes polyzona]|nr:hypothetical protein C8Q77DRAFT_1162288 [Trametes polyzona]
MYQDVESRLELDKDILRLSNVFGNPYREKQLTQYVRRQCSNVRNAFRADIVASISGDTQCTLKDFSWASAKKYKLGGPGDKLDVIFMAHNALLRRFALDHPAWRTAAEKPDVEAAAGDSHDVAEAAPPSKKRKRASGPTPRPPKGEDFWSRVDEDFTQKVAQWGPKITSDQWKTYLERIIKQDEQMFPHPGDTNAPTANPTSAPATAQSTRESVNVDGRGSTSHPAGPWGPVGSARTSPGGANRLNLVHLLKG